MGPCQVADGCRGSAPAPIGWARRPSGGRTRELAWTERPTPPPGQGASTPIARNHPSRPGRPRHPVPTRPGTPRPLHRPACWTPSAPARPHSRRCRHRPPTTAARASKGLRRPRPTRRVRSIASRALRRRTRTNGRQTRSLAGPARPAPPPGRPRPRASATPKRRGRVTGSRSRRRLPPRPLDRRWASQSGRSVPLQTRTPRTTRALSRRPTGAQQKVGPGRAQWSRATRSGARPLGRVGGDQTVQGWMRPAERLGRCRWGARRRRLPRSLRRPFPKGNPRRCRGRPLPAVPWATGPLRPPHATRNQIPHHSRPPATGSAPQRRPAAKAAPPSLPLREPRPLQVPPPLRTGPPRRPLPISPPHWNGPPATSPPTPAARRRRTVQRPRPAAPPAGQTGHHLAVLDRPQHRPLAPPLTLMAPKLLARRMVRRLAIGNRP
jgi:hypothetical protein